MSSLNSALGSISQKNELQSSNAPSFPFEKAVVVNVIYDNKNLEKIKDQYPDLFSSFPYERIPRNSCLVRRISDNFDSFSSSITLAYPFFSSHISMPIKVGETVWIIFDRDIKTTGYWISRVHGDEYSEDLNYSHYDRTYANKQNQGTTPGTIEKANGNKTPPPPEDFPNLSLKRRDEINEYEKITSGSLDPHIFEPVPRFFKRPGDLVIHGSNNSMILFGTERYWKKEDEVQSSESVVSQPPKESTGVIDLVAGRARSISSDSPIRTSPAIYENTRKKKEIVKDPRKGEILTKTEGDPDFFSDASRIYVSMNSSIDEAFTLADFTPILPNESQIRDPSIGASIALKTDHVRIIARKDEELDINGTIRIIKEGEISNEGDGCSIILHDDGAIHIAASKIHLGLSTSQGGDSERDKESTGEGQPYVRYQELKIMLEAILDLIDELAKALSKNAPPGYSAPDVGLLNAGIAVSGKVPGEKSKIQNIKSSRIFGE